MSDLDLATIRRDIKADVERARLIRLALLVNFGLWAVIIGIGWRLWP